MINSTRMIGLIMIAATWAGVAAAQQFSTGDWEEELPSMSTPFADDPQPGMTGAQESSVLRDSISIQEMPNEVLDPNDTVLPDLDPHGVHGLWHDAPAEIESTGTWLRRGFWYAEVDGVVWNRTWNRDPLWFAAQDQDVERPDFFTNRLTVNALLDTNRLMILQGAQPGEDASVRATLGHFLFRDSHNRDHNLEFTAMGGGNWVQHRQLSSEEPFGLFVPYLIDGGNRSFDRSSFQELDYSSKFASFEFNYHVKQRLRRDQMVMDANGHWHRAANSGFVRNGLAGIRMFEQRDLLNWTAEDIVNLGDDGSYFIRTDNDMIGLQLGGGTTYEAARWSLGAQVKGGVYVNDAIGRTTLNFTADNADDADLFFREDELSFVGEFQIQSRWYVTPNFAVRAAYEMMYLTSQALAPNQATFITDFSYLNTTQDPFYHGASFGLEGYW